MTSPLAFAADPLLNDDHWLEGRVGLAIIAAFFGVFLGWAALAPLDSGVVGPGVVKVSGNRQTIQHREGGTISRVFVKEGERVAAGQPVIDLSSPDLVAEEQALGGQILDLEAALARLGAERRGATEFEAPPQWAALPPERRAFAAEALDRARSEAQARATAFNRRVAVLREQADELSARIDGSRREIESVDRQMRLAGEELAALRSLEQEGFAASMRVRAAERGEAELTGRRAQLESFISQTEEAISRVRLEALSAASDRQEAIAREQTEIETRLADLRPRYAAVAAKVDRARVRAPEAGVVMGLAFFNAGAVVQPGERILDIVPEARSLVIEAQIPTADADDIAPGQRADVSFKSLGGRGQTRAHGEVRRISADRLQDQRTGRDYFVIEVEVPQTELEKLAQARGVKTIELKPGLPAEVIIPLRGRTALQYLLEPLEQSVWRSFREQ